VLDTLSNQSSGDIKVKAIATTLSTAAKAGSMAHELSKIVTMTDNVCENLTDKISDLHAHAPKLAGVIESKLKPLVSH
jgi:hypothetical protein